MFARLLPDPAAALDFAQEPATQRATPDGAPRAAARGGRLLRGWEHVLVFGRRDPSAVTRTNNACCRLDNMSRSRRRTSFLPAPRRRGLTTPEAEVDDQRARTDACSRPVSLRVSSVFYEELKRL